MPKKITDVKIYDTLCNNNNWVQYKLKALRKAVRKDPELLILVNECLDILRYMKTQGIHLENRLKLYYNSILKLGFQRIGRKE